MSIDDYVFSESSNTIKTKIDFIIHIEKEIQNNTKEI